MISKVRIGKVADFPAGQLTPVEAAGTKLFITRDDEGLCAARNRCPHMALPLTSGPGGQHVEGGVVTCPWHNSRFVVRSGENIDWVTGFAGRDVPGWSQKLVRAGRTPAPLTTYPVSVEGDDVFVAI